MDTEWRVTIDTGGIEFPTATILPFSIAAAVVGRQFGDIVEDHRDKLLFLHDAIIVRSDVTDEGTVFNLSMAKTAAGCKLPS